MKRATLKFSLLLAGLLGTAGAQAIPVTFTKLTGLTGTINIETAVYRADLSGLGLSDLTSITINDNSGGTGGASGQFSGFDLDAIALSYSFCTTAACAAALPGLGVFDFSPTGTQFTPGTQRPTADPKLFGTDVTGNNVDNSVATLGAFDANSTTAIPGADGFVSMGDNGILRFDLVVPLSTTPDLYLYIGEVGDNGEVADGTITVTGRPVPAPEPGTLALLGLGLAGFGYLRRRRR